MPRVLAAATQQGGAHETDRETDPEAEERKEHAFTLLLLPSRAKAPQRGR
jgi:hypothetical protein